MDTGKYTAREAVTEAMGEIVGPIVGVVLVLLAVFIPTTFISGISGQLYKQFALTIAAATVLSGFNSLTLTPALCALFLQANKEPKFFVFKAFNKVFGKTQKIYDDIVGRMLKNPFVTMVIFGIITAIAIVMFMRWPTTFIPEEDDGYFLISTQLPPAASLNRTEAVGKQIDKILDSYPEIKTYIGVNGFSIMGGGELSNAGTYFVILKNWNERKGKEHTASAVVNRFNREAYGIQEAQIFAMVPPAIPGLGASGGLQLQLEDRNNLVPTEMQHAIETLQATYRSKPQLLSLSSMYQANVPQYNLSLSTATRCNCSACSSTRFCDSKLLYGSRLCKRLRRIRAYLPGKDRGQRPSSKSYRRCVAPESRKQFRQNGSFLRFYRGEGAVGTGSDQPV